jgi:hypothetical protein
VDPSLLDSAKHLTRSERRNLIFVRDLLLTSACIDCGEADLLVLEFDHRSAKDGNVLEMARRGCSLERLRAEIQKCEIRCGNCHRRRTAEARRPAVIARSLGGPP